MRKKINPNRLWTYRRKKGISQKRAAFLLAHKTSSQLSHYERGVKTPNLKNALKLEILYNVPVAFLFRDLFLAISRDIKNKETALSKMLEKE